jgi:4-hydroxybenzoate polyprenyltransferase
MAGTFNGVSIRWNSSKGWWPSLRAFLADIKISHSVFALPFAAATLLVLSNFDWTWALTFKLIGCMVAARTFAMGANRVFDHRIDALNPRTRQRGIPGGALSAGQAAFWTVLSGLIFVGISFSINQLTGFCSLLVLLILGLYPKWKHWSWLTHWYLGLCLGLSPMAVSVAALGIIEPVSVLIGLAVALWTAGFDIIYAIMDHEFDVAHRIQSVPARFGISGALWISKLCFSISVITFISAGVLKQLGWFYYVGIFAISTILVVEHFWVRDAAKGMLPKRINAAFFNLNASVSLVFFFAVLIDWLLQ